ncbi:hypothetical protein TUBRATIS_30120 [Tubulinosema ratisbonensis]|uniref:Uncharacterized protein n=1 Tax=Tubulinosema ratisbonensis TaxID=291195 RepID=A0A437AHF1_9MICR|nr:hypothetical protein TUBRATIS_30120 [Tubulinosema ratisbonensis]
MDSLEIRLKNALNKWTVIKLIEQHLYEDELETLLNNLTDSILKLINKCKTELILIKYDISDCLFDILDINNIETDDYSCDSMALILIDLCKEYYEGKKEFYHKITGNNF